MTKFRVSLKIKLITLVLIALIPLIILYLVGINNQFNENIEEELKTNLNHSQTINITFLNFLEENWSQQYAIGIAILSNPHWSSTEVEIYISEALSEKRNLKGYSWISPDGFSFASSNVTLTGMNVREMEFYQRIINGETKVVSNLNKSIIDDDLIIHIARGIYVDDELKGIMLGIVDTKTLSNIFKTQAINNSTRFGLVDNNGMMVYRHNYPDLTFNERMIRSDSPLLKAINGEIVTFSNGSSQYDITNRLGAAYPIEEIGWASYYSVSTNEVTDKLFQSTNRDIFILVLTSIASLLLATFLGNKYAHNLEELKDAANEISKGNLKIKTNFTGRDEIAATGEAFNRMTDEINNQLFERDELVRLKSQFFSTVSHEFKTPINIILGTVQLMESLSDINKESIRKYINMQKQNSYRLLRLINNLIDINRIEGNQFTVNPINCNIVALVEDIITSVASYVELRNIELIFDTDIEEKIIAVDPDKIERIILNLISNAIKFTEPGGTIEVNIQDNNENVKISVKDTGIGIPECMYQSIFDHFTQVDTSLNRRTEGSGIGLSLVKSLIEMHGGIIYVNSVIDVGSEFIIELPAILAESNVKVSDETFFTNVERINIEFSDIYM